MIAWIIWGFQPHGYEPHVYKIGVALNEKDKEKALDQFVDQKAWAEKTVVLSWN